jgi:histone acetyltransferase
MPRAKPKAAAARRASSRTTATPRPVSSESSLSPLKAEDGGLALDPDLLGQVDMLDGIDGGEGEENTDAALLEELEMGLGIIPSTDEPGDVDMEGTGEEAEDDAEEETDDEEEDAEEDDDDAEEEDEDDEEEEEEDDEEEDAEDDGPPREEWVDCPEEMTFRYPASVPDFNTLTPREQAFKCARFLPCQAEGCQCEGLEPPMSSTPELQIVSRAEIDGGELEDLEAPDGAEDGAVEKWRSEEGWWRHCGRCGHGWEGGGHVFAADETRGERVRKGRVVGRIEEFLDVRVVLSSDG